VDEKKKATGTTVYNLVILDAIKYGKLFNTIMHARREKNVKGLPEVVEGGHNSDQAAVYFLHHCHRAILGSIE